MNKPIITLKNIKHMESLSEETNCYSAALYVDGKKWGTVSNHGHGGCDDVHLDAAYTYGMLSSLEAQIKETYPSEDYQGLIIEPSLETICGDLIEEFLTIKDAKKTVSGKVTFTKDGDVKAVYSIKANAKTKQAAIEHVQKKYPTAVIWNTLSDAELVKAFNAAV